MDQIDIINKGIENSKQFGQIIPDAIISELTETAERKKNQAYLEAIRAARATLLGVDYESAYMAKQSKEMIIYHAKLKALAFIYNTFSKLIFSFLDQFFPIDTSSWNK